MRYYNAMLGVLGKHSKDDGKELGLPALLLGLFNRGFVVLLGLGFYDGVLRGFWKKLFIGYRAVANEMARIRIHRRGSI